MSKDRQMGLRVPALLKEGLEDWLKAVNKARVKASKEPVKLSELIRALLEKSVRDRSDVGL